MIIAEDFLLLAYDDDTGKPDSAVSYLDYRLGGALLIELALAGRIEVVERTTRDAAGRRLAKGTVVVRDPAPTGNATLDRAAAVVGERPRATGSLLGPLSKGVRTELLEGLAARGVLRREEGRVLGLFPTTAWPAEDSTHELALRAECEEVLLERRDPTERTAALLALTHGTSLVNRLVPAEHRKQAKARVKKLTEESWAHGAVKKAVDDINTALMVAVMIPAIAGASTG